MNVFGSFQSASSHSVSIASDIYEPVAPPLGPTIPAPNALSVTEYASKIATDLVDIYVGPDKKHWRVHRGLLEHAGRYFTVALAKRYPEGIQLRINFPEDDPDAFELFVCWLYLGDVPHVKCPPYKKLPSVKAHIRLYFLADKLCLTALQNTTIDELFHALSFSWDGRRSHFPADMLAEIFANTTPTSGLRRLFADYIAMHELTRRLSPRELKIYEKRLGPEFLSLMPWAQYDVLNHFSNGNTFEEIDPEKYHTPVPLKPRRGPTLPPLWPRAMPPKPVSLLKRWWPGKGVRSIRRSWK